MQRVAIVRQRTYQSRFAKVIDSYNNKIAQQRFISEVVRRSHQIREGLLLMSADASWIAMEDDGFVGLVGPIFYKPFIDGIGKFCFTADNKHRNRSGFVQGGMLMTFADRSLGTTARQDNQTRTLSTIQLNTHFIQVARIGDVVEMECRILKETRSLIFMQGKITVADELIATADGIWKIINVA